MSTGVEKYEGDAATAEGATARSPRAARLLAEVGREVRPFKIRDVEISPPLVLSPMAGVTDVPFRALLKRRGGIGLTVSEFISVEGLTRNNPKLRWQMRCFENERPFAVQVCGGQAERMRMTAELAEEVRAD